MHPGVLLQLLILVTVANGTPVIAKRVFGDRLAFSIDSRRTFVDGRPIFGRSKTFRGLVLAILFTAICAPLVGLDWQTGLLVGITAMAGDLLSSFVKRRLGLPPHSQALALDQIPEVLFPLLACRSRLDLGWFDIVAGVTLFAAGELLVSRWLYRAGVRDRPY